MIYHSGKRRFSVKLWKTFTDCFNCLPIAAIVDEKIFCCHGGKNINDILLHVMNPLRRKILLAGCLFYKVNNFKVTFKFVQLMSYSTVPPPDIGNPVMVRDRIRTATVIAVNNFRIAVFCYVKCSSSAEETNRVQTVVYHFSPRFTLSLNLSYTCSYSTLYEQFYETFSQCF